MWEILEREGFESREFWEILLCEDLLEYSAGELGEPRIEEADVVLVTHKPLVAAVFGDIFPNINPGKVYEYPLYGWINEGFVERDARLLDLR